MVHQGIVSAQKFLTRLAGGTGIEPLPFLTDAVKSEGAQFKLFAKPSQYGRLHPIVLLFEGAGDVIGALALLAVVDEVILAQNRLQPLKSFRIDARPKEGEVADVAMKFAARSPLGGKRLRLDHHFDYFFQPLAASALQPKDVVHVNEPRQQLGKVIDERRIAQA